jgi:hypothetical protein
MHVSKDTSLTPHISGQHQAWIEALTNGDTPSLERLALTDHPAATLLEFESFINGLYLGSRHPLSMPESKIRSNITRILPLLDEVRSRLGWRVRDFDLGLLCMIRRSRALSPVLGAGVSMGAGAPSWSHLVRLMLLETLDKGLELHEPVPADDHAGQVPVNLLPDAAEPINGIGTRRVQYRIKEVKRYTPEQERMARNILSEIETKGPNTDVETLMHGAQVCYDLCGQHLFKLLTMLLYTRAKEPSETHRAIAELAHAQEEPDHGPGLLPGWDAIITYNIDALMSEALAEQKVPHAAWAMKGDRLRGDPDELAEKSSWCQDVYHLHGYTPRRLFLITDIRYVFSTSQYLTTYRGPRSEILHTVFNRFLSNPVHIALYIGCSFTDAAMNNLLREAFDKHPGRYHYALLQWPRSRDGRTPSPEEIMTESARYLEFGVRPIWYDDHEELPDLIRQLK